jgi:molecular chaperone GrpE
MDMRPEKEFTADPRATAPAKAEGKEEERTAGADPPGSSSAASGSEGQTELATAHKRLQEEKEELYDRLLRKQAELENARKRLQREKEEFLQHATADLIRALLPALDGFERALKQRDGNVPEEFYAGMELIYRNLLEVLGRAGLAAVETKGKLFDPHVHQAVETVEAPGFRDQEIVEELQRGYKLKNRLLRPAIVKVAVARRRETSGEKKEAPDPASEPTGKTGKAEEE